MKPQVHEDRALRITEAAAPAPAPDAGPDLRPASLFFEVFVLGQAVRRLLAAAMAGGPLSPEEYAVYSAVFEGEGVTPTAMAATLSMPLTTVMDWVTLLERRGHARRRPHPRDGRATLVTLTTAGLGAHREANRRFEAAYHAFLDALPAEEAAMRSGLVALRTAAIEAAEPR